MAITDNLLAYWKFNGNANDALGNNNGIENSVSYTTGLFDSGINSGYVEVNSSQLNLTSSMSFACWIKPLSGGQFRFLFTRGVSNNPGTYEIRLDPSKYLEVFGLYAGGGQLANNVWHHFVVTRDSNGLIKTYHNGAFDRSMSGGFWGQDLPSQRTLIGTRDDLYSTLDNGIVMDEVAVWNRDITSQEVADLYNSGAGVEISVGGGGGGGGNFRPLKWLTQVTASETAVFEEGADLFSQKILNVAAGAASTDAINYGQLTDQSSSLKTYIDAGDTTIQNNINSASSSLKSYVDAADSALQTNINNASSSIVSYVDAADSAFQGNLDAVSSSLVSYADAAAQTAQNTVNAASSTLKLYSDAANQTIQNSMGTMFGDLDSMLTGVQIDFNDWLNAASSSLSSAISAEATARTNEDSTDRKSTRLNSSHRT